MMTVMKRVVLTIVTWAFVFALPAVPLEGLPNLGVQLPDWAYVVDMWPQALAIPGAIAGAIFLAVLALIGRAGDFESRPAVWLAFHGLLSGIFTSLIVRMTVDGESATAGFVILVAGATLGALAAPVSAALLRWRASRRARTVDARA
jgi:uncharacterized YccA/Bax inhibitor family protein